MPEINVGSVIAFQRDGCEIAGTVVAIHRKEGTYTVNIVGQGGTYWKVRADECPRIIGHDSDPWIGEPAKPSIFFRPNEATGFNSLYRAVIVMVGRMRRLGIRTNAN